MPQSRTEIGYRQRLFPRESRMDGALQEGKVPRWGLAIAIAVSLLLPLCLFGWIAFHERARALEEADRTAVRTVVALHEHAAKVLETHELILDKVDDLIRGRPWSDIELDKELHEYLTKVNQRHRQVRAISLVDADGLVRMTTLDQPPSGIDVSNREYFIEQRARGTGTYISSSFAGQITREPHIALTRRRTTFSGAFDGLIHIAVPLSYFADFWNQFAPRPGFLVPLIRADGQVLARHPAPNVPARLDPKGPFLSRALVQPSGTYRAVSQVDGIERLNAYKQIEGYPVFISFSVETSSILESWRKSLGIYGLYAAMLAAALVLGSTMALRRYEAQQLAATRWREVATRLSAEMKRREAAEVALFQSQKMESIGQLTGGIAHDFNNLLMAVLGSLELFKKRHLSEDARAVRLIDNAIEGARRGVALTRRLLAFARKQDLQPAPVDVARVVQGLIEFLSRSLGPQVRIETRFAPGIPNALVDVSQLELAIINLAVNARDAMSAGGRLRISVDERIIAQGGTLAPGPYVSICIADDGIGMDEQTLARATEPFFTTKEVGKGTGLGLSVVHGFIAQSGGELSLRSRPGLGTTAEILLPVARAEQQLAAPSPVVVVDSPDLRRGLVVLLVDDDPLILDSTSAMLEDLGHTPVKAASAHEAFAIIRVREDIDVVITDHAMPGMTGLQFAAAIRMESPHLGVVLATGDAELPHGAESHAMERLAKPFAQIDLAAVLDRATRRSRDVPEAAEQAEA